jgi:hypothetical protein
MDTPMPVPIRLPGFAAAFALAITGAALAAGAPPSGHLDFDVVRNGEDIGDHGYTFSGGPDDLEIRVHTEVNVRAPIIKVSLYSFTHDSTEAWRNGELAMLTAETDDDGEPHRVTLGPSTIPPASLWSADRLTATRLINTIDGRTMTVAVADRGAETVKVDGGSVEAHHYRISGDLQRDVWYDDDGLLARLELTAEDGSLVTYVRK